MMQKTIEPKNIAGTVLAIQSKSAAHRALICAALAKEKCFIRCAKSNKDIEATARCLEALGAHIERTDDGFLVEPAVELAKYPELDCGESGSTLRFMLPIVAALGCGAKFIRRNHLAKRPLSPLYEVLVAHGAELAAVDSEPFSCEGKISGGVYQIDGGVSSQYISGLLLAMPLLGEKCSLEIVGKIESEPYIALTLQMMRKFGVAPQYKERTFYFSGEERYHAPREIAVEGDWSNAAFFLAMGAIKSRDGVTVSGLDLDSAQGDRKIVDILRDFGAKIELDRKNQAVTVKQGTLCAQRIDAAQIPDLVPILAVVAAVAKGTTEIYNAARLRIKECDRLQAMSSNLKLLGADITETADGLVIEGGKALHGNRVFSYNDHRIAMSMAAAALLCEGAVVIEQAEAVSKSYPNFWEDWASLLKEADK